MSDVLYQNYLADLGLISENAGIGYGSVHLNIAKEIESNSDIPPAKNITDRSKRLRKPIWAIMYIAAIMDKAAKDYKKITGINVRFKPGLLSTLYHIGNVKELAQKRKKLIDKWISNGQKGSYPSPQPDNMGKWIIKNIDKIQYLLNNEK